MIVDGLLYVIWRYLVSNLNRFLYDVCNVIHNVDWLFLYFKWSCYNQMFTEYVCYSLCVREK